MENQEDRIAGKYIIISSIVIILLSVYFFYMLEEWRGMLGVFSILSFITISLSVPLIFLGYQILKGKYWSKMFGVIIYALITIIWIFGIVEITPIIIIIISFVGIILIDRSLKNKK